MPEIRRLEQVSLINRRIGDFERVIAVLEAKGEGNSPAACLFRQLLKEKEQERSACENDAIDAATRD